MIPHGAPPVGARFTKTDARPWTEDGTKGVHVIRTLCEVTKRDDIGCDYVVVEVLENSDAPATEALNPPTSGRFAWFGLAAAMERGRVVPA